MARGNNSNTGYFTAWGLATAFVAAIAITGFVLSVVTYVKVEHNEDDWDEKWSGRHFTRVDRNTGEITFTGDVVVQGNIEGLSKIDGLPFFTGEYTVCEGSAVQLGDAVSWFVPEGSEPLGCIASGFEGIPATTYTSHEELGDPVVVRLVDHSHDIILGYVCNAGASYCWKIAKYDSANARYLPGIEHILDAGGVGVESARIVSLENADYFGVIGSSAADDDILFYVCAVATGVCTNSATSSPLVGDEHFVSDVKAVGIASSGDLIVVAGVAVANNGAYAVVYQLTPNLIVGYTVALEGAYLLNADINSNNQDRDAIQIEHLSAGLTTIRMLIATGSETFSANGATDLDLHVCSVLTVDGTTFTVESSTMIFDLSGGDSFEYSLTAFPGTDNWMIVYNHLLDSHINNLFSGSVSAANVITVASHKSFAATSFGISISQLGSEVEALTAESAVVVFTDTLTAYRPVALIVNVDATGAFVDFGDFVKVSEFPTNNLRLARISSKKFVLTDVLTDPIGTNEFGRIYIGNLPAANGYDGLLHFGSIAKGRSVVGVATANGGSGAVVDVLTAGVYCLPAGAIEALPFTHIGPIFASQDGSLSLSPLDSVSHLPVAQQVGKTVNSQCVTINVFAA